MQASSNREIPVEANRAGTTADHKHDIKKAERAMHEEFQEAKLADGQPKGNDVSEAPGGKSIRRK